QQVGCCLPRAGWRRTEHIAALKRRRNGRGLNGGRARKAFALKGIEQAFIEFKFGKSRYSHVLPLCGALIIDVTAVISICLYGYRLSATSLSRMLVQCDSEGGPDMSELDADLRRDGFTSKQFFVVDDRCAMKVGTDGILLGAWAPVAGVKRILDIGSGSGLLALMLAQRTEASVTIDAVELDASAAQQASENMAESPWASRVRVECADILIWATEQ